jgi:hypothetical protein
MSFEQFDYLKVKLCSNAFLNQIMINIKITKDYNLCQIVDAVNKKCSDLLEAIIGAIYLDLKYNQNLPNAWEMALNWFRTHPIIKKYVFALLYDLPINDLICQTDKTFDKLIVKNIQKSLNFVEPPFSNINIDYFNCIAINNNRIYMHYGRMILKGLVIDFLTSYSTYLIKAKKLPSMGHEAKVFINDLSKNISTHGEFIFDSELCSIFGKKKCDNHIYFLLTVMMIDLKYTQKIENYWEMISLWFFSYPGIKQVLKKKLDDNFEYFYDTDFEKTEGAVIDVDEEKGLVLFDRSKASRKVTASIKSTRAPSKVYKQKDFINCFIKQPIVFSDIFIKENMPKNKLRNFYETVYQKLLKSDKFKYNRDGIYIKGSFLCNYPPSNGFQILAFWLNHILKTDKKHYSEKPVRTANTVLNVLYDVLLNPKIDKFSESHLKIVNDLLISKNGSIKYEDEEYLIFKNGHLLSKYGHLIPLIATTFYMFL